MNVSVTNADGTWTCDTATLDHVIATFLPASLNGLKTELCERMGRDCSFVMTVSEALIMLGDMMGERLPLRS